MTIFDTIKNQVFNYETISCFAGVGLAAGVAGEYLYSKVFPTATLSEARLLMLQTLIGAAFHRSYTYAWDCFTSMNSKDIRKEDLIAPDKNAFEPEKVNVLEVELSNKVISDTSATLLLLFVLLYNQDRTGNVDTDTWESIDLARNPKATDSDVYLACAYATQTIAMKSLMIASTLLQLTRMIGIYRLGNQILALKEQQSTAPIQHKHPLR